MNCVHKQLWPMPEKEIKQPGPEGQIQMASVFILEMRTIRQKEHTAPNRSRG